MIRYIFELCDVHKTLAIHCNIYQLPYSSPLVATYIAILVCLYFVVNFSLHVPIAIYVYII